MGSFRSNFSFYLILGTAFVEDGNSITLILLLDFEAKTTASEKQNTRRECQRCSHHFGIHSLITVTWVLRDYHITQDAQFLSDSVTQSPPAHVTIFYYRWNNSVFGTIQTVLQPMLTASLLRMYSKYIRLSLGSHVDTGISTESESVRHPDSLQGHVWIWELRSVFKSWTKSFTQQDWAS